MEVNMKDNKDLLVNPTQEINEFDDSIEESESLSLPRKASLTPKEPTPRQKESTPTPKTPKEPTPTPKESTPTPKEAKSIEQVTNAQSSIERLRSVVQEKEDIIVSLQNTLFESYQAALQEQAHDQSQLEAFYAIFLANVGSQDNTGFSSNLHQALQEFANQEGDAKSLGVTSTLIKAIARLMNDYLLQLVSLHEHGIQTLQKSNEFYKKQCQMIESQLVEERLHHQLQINNINERFQNKTLEDDHQRRNELKMYQDQLKNKISKLKALKEKMRLAEVHEIDDKQKNVKKEENVATTIEHAKTHAKINYLQSQVATLTIQLRQAKQTSTNARLVDHVNNQAVKLLQEETTKGKEITHKLAVQLAQYRHKEKKNETIHANNQSQNENHVFDNLNDIEEKKSIQVLPHIHAFQDRGFNEKGDEPEISKETLTKKLQNLQTKLKDCKDNLKNSEESRRLCEKMIQDHKIEALQCRKQVLENKKSLYLERRKQGSTIDCLKIKKLLENLEEVENDNTKLQKVVMVDQESTITKLKKEVKELKRFCIEMGKEDVECNIHEYDIPAMENAIIPHKESEVLQLRFDRDQALWKLGQLERRMHILFQVEVVGVGPKTEAQCEYFISPTTAPHAFAGKRLMIQEPTAISLMRAFTKKFLAHGSLPREKELECVVEGLLRVVEKKRLEVEHLQQACHDTIQHVEQSKHLQQQLYELRGTLWNNNECCQSSTTHYDMIADLKKDVEKLKQANTNLLHSLKETEDSYLEVQEKLHESTKDKFSPRKRCSFNEAEQHELSDLEVQAQEISRLQKEMGEKSQIVSDMKSQLEARDDELDFLHGQLAINEALASHKDEGITREEMAKEDIDIENLTLENLQMENYELSKVCSQYEELLDRQAQQLGIPFQPLRSGL